MLKQRVVTAVLMLLVFLPALWADSTTPLMLVLAGVTAAALWEWARLNGLPQRRAVIYMACVAVPTFVLVAGFPLAVPYWAWWVPVVIWVIGGAWLLLRGQLAWQVVPRWCRLGAGSLLVVMAVLALLQIKAKGIHYLLSVFLVVWGADVFAYFGGKAFGRHKLAPSISPGKTWEGVLAGMFGVCSLAGIWLTLANDPVGAPPNNFFSHLNFTYGWVMWAILLFIVGMSVVGDLVESLVKRQAGVKDSSRLLPGHGGVLDRIDALLPVFPLVAVVTGLT
jgi:phosphatidate cytidylyltransferase